MLVNTDQKWKCLHEDLTKILQDLSLRYESEMGESLGSLRKRLQTKQFSLPPLQVKVGADFSQIQTFLARKAEIEREQSGLEEQQRQIEIEIAQKKNDADSFREEKEKLERRRLDIQREHDTLDALRQLGFITSKSTMKKTTVI